MLLSARSSVGRNSDILANGRVWVIRHACQNPYPGVIGCTCPCEDDLRVEGNEGLDGEGDGGNQGERY
jgi:hypothetical protein